MFDLDLRSGERIVFVGTEQCEFFTEGKAYNVIDVLSLKGKTHILLLDDINEENFITIPFFKKNFRKVEVVIRVSSDSSFTTETIEGVRQWENTGHEDDLELLTTLFGSIGVGYEVISEKKEEI